jgi:hypothetical protein
MFHERFAITTELREWTARRLAAAKRAVQREADAMALFPELRRFHTEEERMTQQDGNYLRLAAALRKGKARCWRDCRRILRELPADIRARVLAKWETRYMPGSPENLHATILMEAGEPHTSRLRAEAIARLMAEHQPGNGRRKRRKRRGKARK